MRKKRVSVAEGKRAFTLLLREAKKKRIHVVIYNERQGEVAGVLLSPEEYDRYTRLRALFDAIRLSQDLQSLNLNAVDLARQSRRDLEARTS